MTAECTSNPPGSSSAVIDRRYIFSYPTHLMSTARPYEGHLWSESTQAATAVKWKGYWAGKIKKHLGESVLEVGAGLGANIPFLLGPAQKEWLSLEPDPQLAARIPETLAAHPLRDRVKARVGVLQDLPANPAFDTILYIDVLEHIEHDRRELEDALARLKPGGRIVVLSPAYQSLYTEFDRGIGHYRRYNRKSLAACTPAVAALRELYFLDSVGVMASLANKLFLHQSAPTPAQTLFWDRYLVGASILIDPLVAFGVGKSIIGVWTKN
jgi:SAM-dependent methyltransferase